MAGSASIAWRAKKVPASAPFLLIQICAFLWCFFYGVELCCRHIKDAVFFANVEYIGIVFLPAASAVFALVYSNRMRRPSIVGWAFLAVQPIVVLPLVWMNPGEIFRQNPHMERVGEHYLLAFDPGPAFYFNVAISHTILLYVWGTFLYLAIQRDNAFRKQARVLFLAYVFPIVGNIVYHLGFEPIRHYDVTPAMFSICGVIITYSLFRLSFLDLAPIARGTAVEQLLDPVIVLNNQGKMIDCNRAASKVLHLAPEFLLGQDANRLLASVGRFTESNVGTGTLYHHRDRIFAVKRSPLNDPFRGEIGQVIHFSDLTERLELERNLSAAKEEADAASTAKSNFLANMSHEIRTPMNGVIGLADLLEETELSERQRQYVLAIQSCSRSLMQIIVEVLDFSKIEADKMALNPEPVDLIALVKDVVIAHRLIAEGKNLRFDLVLPKLQQLPVLADSSAIRQILNNLIGNATKFTQQGAVKVELREQSGVYIFDIIDTGVGIPADKVDTIFDRFSQADESTTRVFGGTGLGLTITWQLIKLMNGEVFVSSEEGVGSQFRVELTLPTTTLRIAEPAADVPLNLRVLLAEDNAINTMVIESQLEQLGCSITHCENGQETVEAFGREAFDVVLLDIQMPIMGGVEACRIIRNLDVPYVPVVALTANAMEHERDKCLEVGMDAFLTKPTTLKQLRETLHRVTHDQSSSELAKD